ncbi:MAG: ATP-binding protein [candidate division Zixibacteria bacterium]|nr:ATP-binding protein [candidate division Zixibacteria bacterium]
MSIRSRLTLSYVLLFLVVLAIGTAALWASRRWRRSAADLSRAYNQGVAAERLRADIYRQISAGSDFLSGDRSAEPDFWSIQERVVQQMGQLKSAAETEEETDHLEALEETQRELVYVAQNIFKPSAAGARNPKERRAERLDEIGNEVTSDVAVLNQYYQGLEKAALSAAASSGNLITYLVGGAALLALAQLLATVFLLQRWLAGPIAEVGRVTAKISRGDFEAKVVVQSQDEWGALAGAINRMAKALKEYEQKMRAQERLAALGELAAFATHNIRNPLAGIRAASQVMLAECQSQPAIKESLADIIQSVDKLDVWIQRLLGFAKPLDLQPTKTELPQLVYETLGLNEALLESKKIGVTTHLAALPPVLVDLVLMEQVLSALIVNAVEAMDKGGSLTIEAAADSKEAVLRVSDTGKGIPPVFIERVFKPFVTDKPGGTGLGLAQAKKIVDLHGGSIKVESRPGAGTTMTLTLPLWREES